MRRRFLAVASAVSLLLFVATAVLWVRSETDRSATTFHWHGERYALYAYRGHVGIDNLPDVLDFVIARQSRLLQLVATINSLPVRDRRDFERRKQMRVEIEAANASTPPSLVRHRFPLWPVVAGLAILPSVWVVGFHRRRIRSTQGSTPHLRANGDVGDQQRLPGLRRLGDASVASPCMSRPRLNIATAASLLLFIATMAAWIRTDTARMAWTFGWDNFPYALASDRGGVGIDNDPEVQNFYTEQSQRMRSLQTWRAARPPLYNPEVAAFDIGNEGRRIHAATNAVSSRDTLLGCGCLARHSSVGMVGEHLPAADPPGGGALCQLRLLAHRQHQRHLP